MKKILWASKNHPLKSQIDALKDLFGDDVIVHEDGRLFASAEELVKRFKEGGYDDIVLIAPLSVCRVAIELGIKPLWSEMRQVRKEESELTVEGTREKLQKVKRHYKFTRFRRLEQIKMVFSDF
jgi:hypothetical protein